MTTFVYIDYGPSPDFALELKYSFATLWAEYGDGLPAIVVYTDKPAAYVGLHPRLTTRPLGADLARWTRDGLYPHRIKPCVLIDALATFAGPCALVDTDTFFRDGFAATLAAALERPGPVMDHFERGDPCPDAAKVPAVALQSGAYRYAPAQARMYNSGLIGARPEHAPALADSVTLIDAWLDAGLRQMNLEQIAVSEAFRAAGFSISEAKPAFAHYYLRSQKRYMRPRIARWLKAAGLRPTRPLFEPTLGRVRLARIFGRVFGE